LIVTLPIFFSPISRFLQMTGMLNKIGLTDKIAVPVIWLTLFYCILLRIY